MLPRKHRLRRARDVARVRRSHRVARGTLFTVRAARHADPSAPRFVIVVSKRVSKKATERNRLTRQVRAEVYSLLPSLLPGYDVLIVAEKPFPAYRRPALAAELRVLFQRLCLMRSP